MSMTRPIISSSEISPLDTNTEVSEDVHGSHAKRCFLVDKELVKKTNMVHDTTEYSAAVQTMIYMC